MRLPSPFNRKNPRPVVRAIGLSAVVAAAGIVWSLFAPWWLLPFGWLLGGIGLFGFMVLAHDAGHDALFEKHWMNDLAGHLLCLPIAQPYVPMQILHARHHAHLNHVERDPTWKPWSREKYESRPLVVRGLYRAMRQDLWWLGTVFNLFVFHFDPREIPRAGHWERRSEARPGRCCAPFRPVFHWR